MNYQSNNGYRACNYMQGGSCMGIQNGAPNETDCGPSVPETGSNPQVATPTDNPTVPAYGESSPESP